MRINFTKPIWYVLVGRLDILMLSLHTLTMLVKFKSNHKLDDLAYSNFDRSMRLYRYKHFLWFFYAFILILFFGRRHLRPVATLFFLGFKSWLHTRSLFRLFRFLFSFSPVVARQKQYNTSSEDNEKENML